MRVRETRRARRSREAASPPGEDEIEQRRIGVGFHPVEHERGAAIGDAYDLRVKAMIAGTAVAGQLDGDVQRSFARYLARTGFDEDAAEADVTGDRRLGVRPVVVEDGFER